MISRTNFAKAGKFINSIARPLDLAMYNYEFNEAGNDKIIEELQNYQNSDGGFGHGLEPDVRLKASSVLATTVGLQYADFARIDPKHEIIESAINYLIANFNSDENYWSVTNLDVNIEPHAPWWGIKEIGAPKIEEWANPNAEVIGYLNRYSHFVPRELLNQCNSYLSDYLDQQSKITGFIYYKFLCWKRSLPHFPTSIISKVFKMMDETFPDGSHLEKDDFIETHIQWFVTEPTSYLNERYPDFINQSLLKLISTQAKDGGWYPTWEWGSYEKEWKLAKIEWAGKITVETLSVLKYFELIDL